MDKIAEAFDLDVVGALEGTDKSSSVASSWDYLRHYETLFAPWRDSPINLLEIGVDTGSSLNVWRAYFSAAQIVGIDINPACARFAGDRVAIEIGSQEDPAFLHRVCSKYPPTIIIDDGSHLAHHIVYSFKNLFPMLQPGGMYVVEDLEFHFGRWGEQWAGDKSVSVPDYFSELALSRLGNKPIPREYWGHDRYIMENVDVVTFIRGAAVITKRKPHDVERGLTYANNYIETMGATPTYYMRLAQYMVRHGDDLNKALDLFLQATAMGSPSAELVKCHIDILSRLGRLEEASDVAKEGTVRFASLHDAWHSLARVERQLGRFDQAVSAYEKAASLRPGDIYYLDQLFGLFQQKGDLSKARAVAEKAVAVAPADAAWQQRLANLRVVQP